jgi:hypothetical protein
MRRIAAPPLAASSLATAPPPLVSPPIVVLLIAVLLTAVLAGWAAAPARAAAAGQAVTSAVAPASVLVNQPAAAVCVGKTFRVGVWYQPSGGSRAYRVAVYSPRGKRVFYRHGRAPSGHWDFWRIRAKLAGAYHTVYSGHWKSRSVWSRYKVTTRARHCG